MFNSSSLKPGCSGLDHAVVRVFVFSEKKEKARPHTCLFSFKVLRLINPSPNEEENDHSHAPRCLVISLHAMPRVSCTHVYAYLGTLIFPIVQCHAHAPSAPLVSPFCLAEAGLAPSLAAMAQTAPGVGFVWRLISTTNKARRNDRGREMWNHKDVGHIGNR